MKYKPGHRLGLNRCTAAILVVLASAGLPGQALAAGDAVAESDAQSQGADPGQDQDVTDLHGVEVQAKGPPRRTTGGALGGRKDLDTPFSLSTVTAEDLQERQAYSLASIFAQDAGVARAGGSDYNGWVSAILVRGFSVDSNEAVKINGVPGGFMFGVNLPVENMDSVQLLKGSSGFMYGFSSPGGIVNYRTKQPTPYDFLSVDVGYRSGNIFSQHVDMSGQLASGGRLGFRINASHEKGTSYSDSEVERKAVALTLNGRITDTLTWTFDALGQINEIARPTQYFSILAAEYPGGKLPPAVNGRVNPASDQSAMSNNFHYLTAGLYWEVKPDWMLTFNASRSYSTFHLAQEYTYLRNREGDYMNRTLDGLNIYAADFAQLMMQGKFQTGRVQHEPVFGVSWQRRLGNNGRTNVFPGLVTRNYSNIYNPERLVWEPVPEPTDARTSDTSQRSLFVSDTLNMGKWSLLGGLRYTDYTQYNATTRTLDPEGVYVRYGFSRYNKRATTPVVALMYRPHEGGTLYTSYVESLQTGATVGASYMNEGERLDPLLSKQYELGYKYESARWTGTAAFFRLDRGAGYGKIVPGELRPLYVQEGIHRYDGFEAAGNFMLTDHLRWGASVQYIDGVYHDMGEGALRAGKEVEGVAKYMAAMNIQYDVPAIDGLSLHADGKYFGKMTVQHYERRVDNASVLYTLSAAGYTVFNVGGSYRTVLGDTPVTFRAQVQNLFDRNYWEGGYYNFSIGAPRTVALNVQFDF